MITMWLICSTLFGFSCFLSLTSASRILAIVPSPAHSHQVSFRQIWRELSLRGHQVTLMTTDPMRDPALTNLTEIDMHYSYESVADISPLMDKSNPLTIIQTFNKIQNEIVSRQLADENVNKLIRNEGIFDVVMVESVFPEFLAFAEVYKCPKILIASMDSSNLIHSLVGNPAHPVINPEYTLPFTGDLTFFERVMSCLNHLYYNNYKIYVGFPDRHRIFKKYFGDSLPSVPELIRNVDMLFLNVNPVLYDIRPYGPATITFGGGIHMKPLQPLPKDLKQFLDSASEGFVFLSLGSNIKSKDLGQHKIDVILSVLREIPYKVLWKFELQDLSGKPDNVKLIKWAPQQDVLRHPNIKLFITQGGLQSLDESLMSHVPMVVLPCFGDQLKNAKILERIGVAKAVSHRPILVKEEFEDAILEVAQNEKYKKRVEEVARLILDQPMSGVEKVVWWTEYVIRNNGAKHLRGPLADVPFYQFIFLDVAAFLFSVFAFVLAIFVVAFKLTKKFWGKLKSRVQPKKKKIL
ncbi:hypothetical protein JTB14_001747 [Gonioctena quinquepunctata]|nr:hypothetical protein JTB14_001747 [Gonioctena quinquepunctata]